MKPIGHIVQFFSVHMVFGDWITFNLFIISEELLQRKSLLTCVCCHVRFPYETMCYKVTS